MANRETQIAAEVVRTGTSNTRATQITVEAITASTRHVRATQIALEVIVPNYPGNPASLQNLFYEFVQPT